MADPCLHEKDWGRVITLVEDLTKEIYGNGKPGIRHEVTTLSTKIETLTNIIHDLSINVSALVKFENEIKGVENFKDKAGAVTRQKTGLYITAIIGAASIIITLILKYG